MIPMKNWDDCKTACRETEGCHYFEHHKDTNSCYHMAVNYETNENVVSGEDTCLKVRDCPNCSKACMFAHWFNNLCQNCDADDTCTCYTICS